VTKPIYVFANFAVTSVVYTVLRYKFIKAFGGRATVIACFRREMTNGIFVVKIAFKIISRSPKVFFGNFTAALESNLVNVRGGGKVGAAVIKSR
jgi:hypothetical protein